MGPKPSLFVPEMAFDLLVKPQIKLLDVPAQRCVELVYEELIKICHTCGSNELASFPRLQGRLIETVSELLRERLGPTSTYVESLISIQRAYINTNHPNFLGAAAAMSSVMQDRQEAQRRAVAAEEKRKRDARRKKELGLNGGETPEGVEGEEGEENAQTQNLPVRGHASKASRSMSPAVANGIAGAANGRSTSPNRSMSQSQATGPRDSFLNYFFGKDGGLPPSGATPNPTGGHRHISANIEPSFSSSIRRGDNRRPNSAHPAIPSSSHTVVSPTIGSIEEDYAPPFGMPPQVPDLTEREALETELIRRLISSYFDIVREMIGDQVPKAVMHLLVNHSKDVVQNRLVSQLYKEQLFEEMLYEDDGIKAEREKCEKLLKTYKEAARIVGEVL